MDTPKTDTGQSKRKFWKDYEPTQKMTFVMTCFSVIYSVTTIALFFLSYAQLGYLTKDQRPWIKTFSQVTVPDKGNALVITVGLITTGKTPAKSVVSQFFVERVKNGESPQLLSTNQAGGFSTGILFPDGTAKLAPIPYDLLSSDLDDYKQGRVFLVVYGHVGYTDIFHTQHWTNFCGFTSGKQGGYTAEKCTAYNNTDDN